MINILLVADHPDLPELTGSFLERAGCRIARIAAGPEAVGRIRAERPSLVLLDGHEPGFDAAACCREIKADPEMREVPVLLVGTPQDQSRWTEAGGNGFVSHPITLQRLLEVARKHLAPHERESDRFHFAVKVDFRKADGLEGTGYTRDIGVQGVFLLTGDPFRVGDEVELTFALPTPGGKTIRASGVVVRTVSPRQDAHHMAGVAVRLVQIAAADRVEIARLVRQRGWGPA